MHSTRVDWSLKLSLTNLKLGQCRSGQFISANIMSWSIQCADTTIITATTWSLTHSHKSLESANHNVRISPFTHNSRMRTEIATYIHIHCLHWRPNLSPFMAYSKHWPNTMPTWYAHYMNSHTLQHVNSLVCWCGVCAKPSVPTLYSCGDQPMAREREREWGGGSMCKYTCSSVCLCAKPSQLQLPYSV